MGRTTCTLAPRINLDGKLSKNAFTLFSKNPGSRTLQNNRWKAISFPSHKTSELEEPDVQTNSYLTLFSCLLHVDTTVMIDYQKHTLISSVLALCDRFVRLQREREGKRERESNESLWMIYKSQCKTRRKEKISVSSLRVENLRTSIWTSWI